MITGYLTKYDCSSGDINPIGSISKCRIKVFLQYCYDHLNYKALEGVLKETPSAELRPLEPGKKPQTDEEEIAKYEYVDNLVDFLIKCFEGRI